MNQQSIIVSPEDTRLESWILLQPTLGKRQKEVLEELRKESGGLCGHEIARRLNRPTYTVLPRLTELVQKGFVKDSGDRVWEASTQRWVKVWRMIGT